MGMREHTGKVTAFVVAKDQLAVGRLIVIDIGEALRAGLCVDELTEMKLGVVGEKTSPRT